MGVLRSIRDRPPESSLHQTYHKIRVVSTANIYSITSLFSGGLKKNTIRVVNFPQKIVVYNQTIFVFRVCVFLIHSKNKVTFLIDLFSERRIIFFLHCTAQLFC